MLDFLARQPKLGELTNDQLRIRTENLALEVQRLQRRVEELEHASPAIPTLRNLDDCTSPRKLLAYIGRAMGDTSLDTAHLPIRAALEKHANFEDVRKVATLAGKDPVASVELLRWLAQPSKMGGETRFALIHRGAYALHQLRTAER